MRGPCGCRRDGEEGGRQSRLTASHPPASAPRLAPQVPAQSRCHRRICSGGACAEAAGWNPSSRSATCSDRPAGRDAGGGHTPQAPRRPLHCPARLAAPLSPAGSPWSAACSSRPWSRPPPHSVRSPQVDTAGPPLPVLPPEAATEQLPGPPLAPPAAVLQPSHVCSASRRGLSSASPHN